MSKSGYEAIKVEPWEWQEMKREAKGYGMPVSRYVTLAWRNWMNTGAELRLLPPRVVNPWHPKEMEERERA